jgi:hypothetical protein
VPQKKGLTVFLRLDPSSLPKSALEFLRANDFDYGNGWRSRALLQSEEDVDDLVSLLRKMVPK